MKKLLFLSCFILLASWPVCGQQTQESPAQRFATSIKKEVQHRKEQIHKMETTEIKDDLVKDLHVLFIDEQREKLNKFLNEKIESLEKYQSTSALPEQQKQVLERLIKDLQSERRDLGSENEVALVNTSSFSANTLPVNISIASEKNDKEVLAKTIDTPKAASDKTNIPTASTPLLKPKPTTEDSPKPMTEELVGYNPDEGQFYRGIVGFQQIGATASNSQQKAFADFFLSIPAGKSKNVRLWGDLRLASTPQQVTSDVQSFSVDNLIGGLKVNQILQDIEFLAGVEIPIKGYSKDVVYNKDTADEQLFKLSLVFCGGASTPLSPKDSAQIFKIPDDKTPQRAQLADFLLNKKDPINLTSVLTANANIKNIAFVLPDRDRFFRQYYGGVRLKTYYTKYEKKDGGTYRVPAMLDVLFGGNEAITGRLRAGGIFRLDGFIPLPGTSSVYIFGTAMLKLARANIVNPLILPVASSDVTINDPNLLIVKNSNIMKRDLYRIGVGFDLVPIFNKALKKKN